MTEAAAAPPRRVDLATVGAILGLVATGIVVAGWVALTGRPLSLHHVWIGAFCGGPFALALFATRMKTPLRRITHLAAGVCGTIPSLMLIPVGLGLVLLPAAVLLFIAGVRPSSGTVRPGIVVGSLVLVIAIEAASFLSFLALPTPGCWELIRRGVTTVWMGRSQPPPIELRPGEEFGRCTSDAVTLAEAGMSVGAWVFGAGILGLLDRRRTRPA